MATIKDVAQAAQVSTAAVSRVLNKDDNISVSPEVRARIFQAAHVLGYVSPRQRKAAEHKTHLVIGVADWRIIRPDRHNVRLSSLSCLVQMMTDQYEVTFIRLTFGEPQKVDGIIALGVFSEKEIDFLRSLSFAIVFVNSNQHNYEFDQVQVDFDRGQEQMVSYLLDQKRYTGLGYIGGIYDGANGRIGTPPYGGHPAHLGGARPVRPPNLPCGGNQPRKWLCAGEEGRGGTYSGRSCPAGQR